jgi:hypothetical protein
VLADPEVQKFEALIERAKSGGCSYEAVEAEVQGPLKLLAFPSVRGVVTATPSRRCLLTGEMPAAR